MEDNVKLFLKDIRRTCRQMGIRLQLRPVETVNAGSRSFCAGFFDAGRGLIVVAKKHPEWLATLVHESAHMDQWLENSELWQKDEKCGNSEFERWLKGDDVKNIKKAINNIVNLELDADKRAVKKMIEYDLPINIITYIQKQNEYILSYRYMLKTRKWEWSNKVYSDYDKMPTRFMSDSYYKTLSPKIEKIFLEAA